MASSHFRLLEPLEYVKSFIAKGVHSDGRNLLDFRSISLQTNISSCANGSAMVRHGDTVIVASIKVELSEPDCRSIEASHRGRVILSVEGQAYFSEGKLNELTKAANVIQSLLDSDKLVDLSSLCIKNGKLCWTLYVDVVCLDCDGGVLDSCLFAVVAAFFSATLPTVEIDRRSTTVIEIDDSEIGAEEETASYDEDDSNFDVLISNVRISLENRKPVKLARILPLACSFILLANDEGRTLLASDPTDEEKVLFSNDFAVILGDNGDDDETLCGIYKYGGTKSIDMLTFNQCVGLARERRALMLEMIRSGDDENMS